MKKEEKIRIYTQSFFEYNYLFAIILILFMQPVISIVIPVYNREDYLKIAIESVLRQTFTEFELIIWDDGSTDNSVEIASQYAK